MHGGHYIAQNIHKTVLKDRLGQEPSFLELQEVPPMIGLAVGKKAVASGPEGTVSGEDVLQSYFRDDLRFMSEFLVPDSDGAASRIADAELVCWDWIGMGGRKQENLAA